MAAIPYYGSRVMTIPRRVRATVHKGVSSIGVHCNYMHKRQKQEFFQVFEAHMVELSFDDRYLGGWSEGN